MKNVLCGMEFIDDETVIGKWKNIGWNEDIDCFSIENMNDQSGDYEYLFFYLVENLIGYLKDGLRVIYLFIMEGMNRYLRINMKPRLLTEMIICSCDSMIFGLIKSVQSINFNTVTYSMREVGLFAE